MNQISILAVFVLILFATSLCEADSLVIIYRSGKTQTVVLDEPSQGVSSWQFVGGTTPLQQLDKVDETVVPLPQDKVQKTPVKDDKILTEKAQEKKSGIRFKLNAKPIPD